MIHFLLRFLILTIQLVKVATLSLGCLGLGRFWLLHILTEQTAPESLVLGKQHVLREGFMSQNPENEMTDELRSEYDFAQMKGGVRGKYVERYRAGTNLVLLDPDVAEAFPDEKSVNDALRLLMQIAQRQQNNQA